MQIHRKTFTKIIACFGVLCVIPSSIADGIVVDKIYDPYVQPLETELEFRTILQNDDAIGDVSRYSFGIGHALNDRWWGEVYAIAVDTTGNSLKLDAYEAELKWQLTEQGEYSADWGLLFELEREIEDNIWELETSLIVSREWGRWVGTSNLKLIYEWGGGIQNEFETALNSQLRYRFNEKFEPGIELYLGQDNVSMGPAVMGMWRTGLGKKLRWQFGIYPGLGSTSPDVSALFSLEFEF